MSCCYRRPPLILFCCAARQPGQGGFTLIEAIIVIAITGVIAAVVAVFIRAPVQAYVDSEARAELTDTADTALRRMAREIRLALPNSVRVSPDGHYLELLLTKTGGRYLAEEDGPTDTAANRVLRFEEANCAIRPEDCQFDVVGPMPGVLGQSDQRILAGDFIVVYNLGPGQSPADAYNCSVPCNRARVSADPVGNRITIDSPTPFGAQDPFMRSPSKRFQVVSTPVTYFCDGLAAGGAGVLNRHWNYSIQASQPVSSAALAAGGNARSALLATNVVSCVFDYSNVANSRSGLVDLRLTLQTPGANPETVVLFHQIHVDNTP